MKQILIKLILLKIENKHLRETFKLRKKRHNVNKKMSNAGKIIIDEKARRVIEKIEFNSIEIKIGNQDNKKSDEIITEKSWEFYCFIIDFS